jgi:hypothetical protein
MPIERGNDCRKLVGKLGCPAVSRTKQEQITRPSILVRCVSARRRNGARTDLAESAVAEVEVFKMADALK